MQIFITQPLTTKQKVYMRRCASSFVTATDGKVRLIPQDSRALPLEHFASSSKL